ncbi:hypothetical protein SynRS9902_02129 [Synechococcus sp. RS9902]|nr:hypothetical protein SynRS9902_02129 [Synechococcus sp. RS9902]
MPCFSGVSLGSREKGLRIVDTLCWPVSFNWVTRLGLPAIDV